jgi:potassium channel LctB
MKKIISLLHSNIPFIVSTIVLIIVLEMLYHEGWTPIVWFLIITLLVLELYFSSVVRNMLHMRSKYQFVQFISHLSSFTFLSIFLFGFMYSEFGTDINYLYNTVEFNRVEGFDNAFYFSGVTLLSIGYGDIVPYGFFRVISLFEGFIGSFIILSFFSVGLSQIFLYLQVRMKKEAENIEKSHKLLKTKKIKKKKV